MSRGTEDFTVQELMNFIAKQMADIDESLPEKHKSLGYAVMGNRSSLGSYPVTGRISEIDDAAKKRNVLQELLWDVERKCGELYDAKEKLEVQS